MIKHLSQNSLNNLLRLFNRIFTEHVFPLFGTTSLLPPSLNLVKIPLIQKNYRPIALTNCLCKILEKMVNNRLVFILEKKLISPWQNCFKRDRSIIDNILLLQINFRSANLRRNHLVAIFFFNIAKSSDKSWCYGILKDLRI